MPTVSIVDYPFFLLTVFLDGILVYWDVLCVIYIKSESQFFTELFQIKILTKYNISSIFIHLKVGSNTREVIKKMERNS